MKEIIIDGVNVAGCGYYESKNDTGKWCDLTCTRDNAPVFRCEKMPNCNYKQLKRLEKENECLKEKLMIAQNSDNKTMEILKENAELKENIKKYSKINEQETKDYAELLKETNNYRKALEEIREILEGKKDGDIDEMIDKINEVLE